MSQSEFNAKVIAQSTPEQLAELFNEACELVYNLGDDCKYLDNLNQIVKKLEINAEGGCRCDVCEKQCKLTNKDWLAMAHCYKVDDKNTITRFEYLHNGIQQAEWLVLDRNSLVVIDNGDKKGFATKEEAYSAYLEWKRGQKEGE